MADLKTTTTIVSLIIGISGFLFGLFRERWSRRESRLEIVGQIVQPLLEASQSLMRANHARRKAEQLKVSYPTPVESVLEGVEPKPVFPERTQEVVHHVNSLVESYGQHISAAEEKLRTAEATFGGKQFRLPVGVAKQLRELQLATSEFGRLVDAGLFDKADLQRAKCLAKYRTILETARGWRLSFSAGTALIERLRLKRPNANLEMFEFELTDDEMDGVMELVQVAMTTHLGKPFAVHPPKKLLDAPRIIGSDDPIGELKDSVFTVVFQDGTTKMFGLPELMAFNFNLITVANETRQLDRMFSATPPQAATTVNVEVTFSMRDIMQTEMVKVLLKKTKFSNTPSDA